MSPKQIIVTEKNFKWIYSRLKKFFGHRYMSYWHTFDCGNKKRIGKKIDYGRHSKKPIILDEHYLRWPVNASLDERFPDYIFLKWGWNNSWTIRVGDTISFIGNRIIHKKKWFSISGNEYIYYCFQIESADKVLNNIYEE